MSHSPTTRQAILDYLTENQNATSGQLSRALQVTPADIRYHLGILAHTGRIEIVSQRAQAGHGRPMRVFTLAQAEGRNNALSLVPALLSSLPEQEQAPILRQAARHLAGDWYPEGRGLTQRLLAAIKRLNALHYQARWEAHRISPRLVFRHCPYRSFLEAHPEMCTFDVFLLSYLVGQPVEQSTKLGLNAREERYCLFIVNLEHL